MSETLLSNGSGDGLAQLTRAASEALTDNMVERLTLTSANALELLDRLNDEDTRAAVHLLIDKLTDLHKLGAMSTLFDTVTLLHSAREACTDNMVERLFTFFEQMINTVGNERMGALAENARLAIEEASEQAGRAQPRGGLLAMVSLLLKPETHRSINFLLALGDRLQKRTQSL